MKLQELRKKLKEIKREGFVETHRIGDTGIGKTLEDLLDITENNIPLPDFGKMELKSQRINTQSMMTLFTKSPDGVTNKEIRKNFGYKDREFPKIKCLRQTIVGDKRNAKGFHCKFSRKAGKMFIKKDGAKIGFYSLDFLEKKAIEKIGDGLILVLAETRKKKGREFFHYKKAYLLKDIDPIKFIKHLKYDIRLGIYRTGSKRGQPHDHGSAFRLPQKSIPQLFRVRKKLL